MCLLARDLAHKDTVFTESMRKRGRVTVNVKQEAPFKDIPSMGMPRECSAIKIRFLLE